MNRITKKCGFIFLLVTTIALSISFNVFAAKGGNGGGNGGGGNGGGGNGGGGNTAELTVTISDPVDGNYLNVAQVQITGSVAVTKGLNRCHGQWNNSICGR